MFLRSIASLACTAILSAASLITPGSSSNRPAQTQSSSCRYRHSYWQGHHHQLRCALHAWSKDHGRTQSHSTRSGARERTRLPPSSLKSALKIGPTLVPAGSYTLFTVPNPTRWLTNPQQTGPASGEPSTISPKTSPSRIPPARKNPLLTAGKDVDFL